MKSTHAEKFNHDPLASEYDADVADESNPIRKGYASLLHWVSNSAQGAKNVLDLGCGTGNTALAINGFEQIICVDISRNMLDIAQQKLQGKGTTHFIKADLLDVFSPQNTLPKFDTIVSTYAIHHLTQAEKHQLFELILDFLPDRGRAIFGDLMFKNTKEENLMRHKYPHLIEDFDDEFFWNVEQESAQLKTLGFKVSVQQFSDLSWGILGRKS